MDLNERAERLSAAELYAHARFRECLETIGGDKSPQTVILRMRAQMALGRHHDVVRADLLDTIDAMPAPERARAKSILARAYFRCGMRPAAEAAIKAAEQIGFSSGSADALAEARYHAAVIAWGADRIDEAERLIEQVTSNREWRAKALEVRAWIARSRGDYATQMRDLRAAYRSIQGEDVWMKASILHALSAIAREVVDTESITFVETEAQSVAWSADTNAQKFYTFRNLAWCSALNGSLLDAGAFFQRASQRPPSAAHAVLVEVDRVYFASLLGDHRAVRRHLPEARFLAEQADWKNASEERTALLLLAELVAAENPDEADRLVRKYIDISEPISPLLAFKNGDKPRYALEQYVAGVVYRAKGMRREAVQAFKNAIEVWRPIGYNWRVALALMQLGEISRPSYLEMAQALIERTAPSSPFSWRLEPYKRRDHPDLGRLSPQRREILACLICGLSNRDIAERLSISESLVKRQLSEVYHAFGVTSVRELYPVLRERGII